MVALLRAFLLELVFEAAASAWDCKALKITTGFPVGENAQGRGSVLAEASTDLSRSSSRSVSRSQR